MIGRTVGVEGAALTARVATGNNGSPECHFAARRVLVVVNVDSSPQPYSRLERTIVEDGQQFGTERNFTPPQTTSPTTTAPTTTTGPTNTSPVTSPTTLTPPQGTTATGTTQPTNSGFTNFFGFPTTGH